MSSPFGPIKGFKKDRRNLIEGTNNLVVFGNGVQEETSKYGRRCRSRCQSKARQKSLAPGPSPICQSFHPKLANSSSAKFIVSSPWSTNGSPQPGQLVQETKTISISTPPEILFMNGQNPCLNPSTAVYRMQNDSNSICASSSPSDEQTPSPPQYDQYMDAFVCPVCNCGFEPVKFSNVPVSEMMRNNYRSYQNQNNIIMAKKNLEGGWGSLFKPKCIVEPHEVVVAAECGHLFHRLCLREWCAGRCQLRRRDLKNSTVPRHPSSSNKPAWCPLCRKMLKYSSCVEVDILTSYTNASTEFDKFVLNARHVNRELQILWPEALNHHQKLMEEISDSKTIYSQLRSRRKRTKHHLRNLTVEDLGVVVSKITDIETLNETIQKQEKALNFMKQETLQIMRMYLIMIIRKLKDSVPYGDIPGFNNYPQISGHIPPKLLPHLQTILVDDQALNLLAQIVVPVDITSEEDARAKQKYLESKILEQCDPALSRRVTYTVISSTDTHVPGADSESATKQMSLTSNESTSPHANANQNANRLSRGERCFANEQICFSKVIAPPKFLEIVDISEPKSQIFKDKLKSPKPKPKDTLQQKNRDVSTKEPHHAPDNYPNAVLPIHQSSSDLLEVMHIREVTPTFVESIVVAAAEAASSITQNIPNVKEIMKNTHFGKEEWRSVTSNSLEGMGYSTKLDVPITKCSNSEKSLSEKPPKIRAVVELTPPESKAENDTSWCTVTDTESEPGSGDEELDMRHFDLEVPPQPNSSLNCSEYSAEGPADTTVTTERILQPEEKVVTAIYLGNHQQEDSLESNSGMCSDIVYMAQQSEEDISMSEVDDETFQKSSSQMPPLVDQGKDNVVTIKGTINNDEVSIQIMYIIDNEDDSHSSSKDTDSESDSRPNPSLQSILEPVYLTAEKASKYSMIAKSMSSPDLAGVLHKCERKDIFCGKPPPSQRPQQASKQSVKISTPKCSVVDEKSEVNNNNTIVEAFNCNKKSIVKQKLVSEVTMFFENEKIQRKTTSSVPKTHFKH